MRKLLVTILGISALAVCRPAFCIPPATAEPPGSPPVSADVNPLLGLPPLPVPADNPQTPAKIQLGNKLFHDKRFSIDGTISCSSCHDDNKAFTDNLPVAVGHHGLTGTRNAPTVINAAFNKLQFWDGREPSLEAQSKAPFINPLEAGLPSHQPILDIVRSDADYRKAFNEVFGVQADKLTMEHVSKAIASFERSIIAGNSAFDRYYFKADKSALTEQQQRGFQLFLGQGRCVSCHVIEQDQALFTDGRFHNIGIGINAIQQDVPPLVQAFLEAKARGGNVDQMVLSDKKTSELGRFAVTQSFNDMGAFKTPTLRNIALTAPYMHDGSLKTLKDVIIHYNNGGVTPAGAQVNAYLSGGIRPLNLTDSQIDDLDTFLEALTSAQFAKPTASAVIPGDSHDKH